MSRTALAVGADVDRPARLRVTSVAPYVAFLLVSIVLVGSFVQDFDHVSPTDEIAHLDYLSRLPDCPPRATA